MQKVLLLALFCLAVVLAQPRNNKKLWWNDTKALLLKSNNFLQHVGKDKIVIVQFIAQFSRDCQALMPEWDKLALMYQGNTPKRNDVTVALIDGWTFNSISQSYGVTAFPTIIIFGKGDAQTQTVYKGEKKADQMSEFIEQFANGQIPPDPQPGQTGQPATGDANQATPATDPVNTPPQDQQQQQQDQQQQQQDQQQQQQQQAQQQGGNQPNDAVQSPPQQNNVPQNDNSQQNTPPPQAVQQTPSQPTEVNVVLNTSLLQTQFEELQRHTTALNEALQKSINDNFQRFDNLRTLVENQKNDIDRINNNVVGHNSRFEEVKRTIENQKNDLVNSVRDHSRHFEEIKGSMGEVKNKVFERRYEEPKESSGFGSATVMFVVGGLIGAAVTFVVVSAQGNRGKRKLLID